MSDEKFSKLLRLVPKPPLPAEPTKCEACGHVIKPYYRQCPKCEGDRNRRSVDALAVVIRQLKASRNPEGETLLLRQLASLGHPDVHGLVLAIRARLDGGNKSRGPRERGDNT